MSLLFSVLKEHRFGSVLFPCVRQKPSSKAFASTPRYASIPPASKGWAEPKLQLYCDPGVSLFANRYHTAITPLLVAVIVCNRVHPAGGVTVACDQYEKNASRMSPFWTPFGTITVVEVVLEDPTNVTAVVAVAVAVGVAVRVGVGVKVGVGVMVGGTKMVAVAVGVGVAGKEAAALM